ncbi:MAG: ComEC/Rec2 family competence protein, partial [Steroidobacteraceae bacterium]
MRLPLHALTFTAGIVFVATRPALDSLGIAIALSISAVMLCSGCGSRFATPFALGVMWAWMRAFTSLPEELPSTVHGADLVLVGDVVSLPDVEARRTQFDFAPHGTIVPGLPSRIRLSWFHAERAPRAAERWQLEVRVRARRGFANPGGFDYEGELFRAGIGATGYVRASSHNRLLDS